MNNKKKILKKIEKLCKEYVVNLLLCSVFLYIGSYVKDYAKMKCAASFSLMLSWMIAFITWRGRNGDGVDLKHEENINSFDEDHADLIRRRCIKLREEVKNRFADMGIKLDGSYGFGREEYSFEEMIELEALMLYDPDTDSTDFTEMLEESSGVFMFKCPLPDAKYVMQAFKAKQMTEEEKMQREFLKKM